MNVFTPLTGRLLSVIDYVIKNYNSVIHLEKWELVNELPEADDGLIVWDYLENQERYLSRYEVLIFIPVSKEFENLIASEIVYNRLSAQNFRFREDEFLSLFPVERNSVHAASVNLEHVVFNIDIIAQQFFILSGYDEISSPRDVLGRTVYKGSLIEYYKLWSRALADEGFLLLLHAVQSIGIPESLKLHNGYVWRLSLTHDIDHLKKYTIGFLIRSMFSKKNRNGMPVFSVLKNYILQIGKIDPYEESVYELLNITEKAKSKPIYFLRAGMSDKRDSQINYKSDVILKLNDHAKNGHITAGIHPSIKSHSSNFQMQNDWKEFSAKFENHTKIVRQHFLMYDVRYTPQIHSELEFTADYSLGFHDHEGLRRAAVHPFYAFDFENWKTTNVLCVPLAAMDVTFQDYHKLSVADSANRVKMLLDEAAKYQGHISVLIHNSYTENESPEWLEWFEEIVRYALSKYAWLGK